MKHVKLNFQEKVKDFMTKNPFAIEKGENIKHAIDLMTSNRVGSVIIVDKDFKPINILTRSDILKLIFLGYTQVKVEDALKILKKDKKKLYVVKENDLISECLELFIYKNIKHLPVVNKEGKLVGVISATDIIKKVSYLIFIDNLTGLGNRHYLESLKAKLNRFYKNISFGVLMIDIDNFKKLNDTYGHLFGDKVIRKVSKAILRNIRIVDEAIRYGGEEFLVILFKVNKEALLKIAEKIRKDVEKIKFRSHPEVKVTVSIGATLCKNGCELEKCIEKADKALKIAKETGKNKVVFI